MLLVAMLFVVLPLWRGSVKSKEVKRDGSNLEIFRDQIAEMDTDLRNGLLTPDMYEQGKRELQSRLLDEVGEAANATSTSARNPLKLLAIVLAVLLPIASIGLYLQVGNRLALSPQDSRDSEAGFSNRGSASELKALEEKVAANPDNPESVFLLARSYAEMERFSDAAQAFDKLTQMVPNEAQLWADYADVLAMASGRTLLGKPTKLIDKALTIDPANFKALALSGSAAMERGDYAVTVRHWEKLLQLLPKGDANVKVISDGIHQARALMAQKNSGKSPAKSQRVTENKNKQTVQAGMEAITGTVVLNDALKSRARPDDTVFVLVRAAEGPKMPLAIVRKQVKDLPLKFTLDDSTAMSPEMKLSNFDQVVVVARISRTGNAMSQTGDMQGMSATIKPGTKGMTINIDKMMP